MGAGTLREAYQPRQIDYRGPYADLDDETYLELRLRQLSSQASQSGSLIALVSGKGRQTIQLLVCTK